MSGSGDRLRLAVGIATAGRPQILAAVLRALARQTRGADAILLCPAHGADLPDLDTPGVEAIGGGVRGLCAQRNAILDRCGGADVVVFLDDDFLPAPDFLAAAEACLRDHPGVVAATGRVIADGVTGPGMSVEAAQRALDAAGARDPGIRDVHNAYGCNMAIRLAPVRAARLRFDEALPLYGWQEDVDFSRRLAGSGRIVRCGAMVGVHLGAKAGRLSGVRFGYSQVANPVHLRRKGTLAPSRAARQMARNVLSNVLRAPWPEPWCDRRGRLRGNALAARDWLRGRLDPRRILDL